MNEKRKFLIERFSANPNFDAEDFDFWATDAEIDEIYNTVVDFLKFKRIKTKVKPPKKENTVICRESAYSHIKTDFGKWYYKRYGLPADNMKQYQKLYRLYRKGTLDMEE